MEVQSAVGSNPPSGCGLISVLGAGCRVMRSGVLKRAKSFEISGVLDLSPKRTCCNLLDSLKCELTIAKDRASGIGGAHAEGLDLAVHFGIECGI